MDAGQAVSKIILGEHDPADLRKELRLILAHPKQLRGGEAGKGQIARQRQQALLAEVIVERIGLLAGAAVIPEDGGTDHLVVLVQGYQTVHLAAEAQTGDLGGVDVLEQLGYTNTKSRPPLLGILLRPTGLRHHKGIGLRRAAQHRSLAVNQKDLHGRSAQINTDIKHEKASFLVFCLRRDCAHWRQNEITL